MVSDGELRPMSASQSETFHIAAMDPGLVAGVGVITVALGPSFKNGFSVGASSSEMPWIDAVRYLERWGAEGARICTERYDITSGRGPMTAQPDALKANGALEYVCTLRAVTFRLHPRAEVKKVVTDKVLRDLGWYKKTKDGHANDALRVAGFELLRFRPELWLLLTEGV